MNLDLKNKTALVCGSTQGIGKAAATALASLGARVVLFARNEHKMIEVLGELSTNFKQTHAYLLADFSRPGEVKEAIEVFARKNDVQIVVNNTGGPPAAPLAEASAEDFLNGIRQHVVNSQYILQAVLPGMKKAGYGRIINIISTSVKQPITGLGVSNTIRGAMANWAKTLAGELGPFGITVNNVLPGFTLTGRLTSLAEAKAQKSGTTTEEILRKMAASTPARRLGKTDEVAAAVAFLATPVAAYINGINLPVDGGRTGCL